MKWVKILLLHRDSFKNNKYAVRVLTMKRINNMCSKKKTRRANIIFIIKIGRFLYKTSLSALYGPFLKTWILEVNVIFPVMVSHNFTTERTY